MVNIRDMSFSIDGHDIPISGASYNYRAPDGDDLPMLRREATAEYTIPLDSFAFSSLFFKREPSGASQATLVRRLRYGGRKGRSARRRLLAMALPIEIAYAHGKMHGRGIMLDETEMLVRLRST